MSESERDAELSYARSKLGQRVLERYTLEAVLGAGGLGVVYRALDERTGELVAVKRVRELVRRVPTAAARFLREARIAQELSHPAIPRGIDAGLDDDGAPVLVMEYVVGKNVGDVVEAQGPLPVWDALAIAARVAEALAVAHDAGFVHRDVKPDNVMLLDGAELPNAVCVLDFGIAYCLDEPRLSVAGTVAGSPDYMSPEQAKGLVVTPASDLYSLGATLAFMLTGQPLYEGTTLELMMAHARAPLPSFGALRPDLPRPVERYLVHLLAKNPAGRPSSAREAAQGLGALAASFVEASGAGTGASRSESALMAQVEVLVRGGAAARDEGVREGLLAQRQRAAEQLAQAERGLLEQLEQLAGQRLERDRCERRVARAKDARERDEYARRLASLGDDAEALRRERALEAKLAELRAHARAQREELDEQLAALRAP